MPHTVNGIGTHYYGKKKLQTRPGVCEFCRRETMLSSYDTRLWFVVLFIPIVPLGRKHILNYCPRCTRHRVTSLTEWEKIKNKNLSEAMAAMTANPNDPKAAIKAHGALIAFGQTGEAEKLMLMMKERFANDALTQVYLGSILQYLGKHPESIPYYERALSLDPENAEAKVAVALDLVQKNRLDEAHKLLQFLEAPGQMEFSGALLGLANGYQRAGRHAEALKLFNLLLERYPKLAQDKKFRQAFKKSQAATGSAAMLPPRKIRWGPMAALGSAIALLLAIALGSNYYISQHQTLYLASGFSQPVTVQIPGHRKATISNHGLWTMTMPEGKYQVTLSGATSGTVEITIATGFWDRWFRKPLFVLNAGGSALLLMETATYSAHPANGDNNRFAFYFGKPFVSFAHIDFPFTPLPDKISLDTHSSSAQKSHTEVFNGGADEAFVLLTEENRMNEALDLAEWHLHFHPDAVQMLAYYAYFAENTGQKTRALNYFGEGIKRRPVEIEWHRMYQETRIAIKHDAPQVMAEYGALLQGDPTNSALLYLYGRLQTSKKKAMPLYQQAVAQNTSNYFAHFALGQSYLDYGEWAKALPELTEADRLRPGFSQFEEELYLDRLALKDYSGLETDLQAKLRAKPLDLQTAARLGDVYIAEGRSAEADKMLAGCQRTVSAKYPGQEDEVLMGLRARLLYTAGKFDELAKLGMEKSRPKSKVPDKLDAYVELGRLQDAADSLKARGAGKADPYELLVLSAAWKQSGNSEKAAACRAEAADALPNDRPENAIAATWLKGSQAIPLEDVMDLSMSPERKRVLLVVLAQTFPDNSEALLAAARNLNINRGFPFHLIDRITGIRKSP